MRCTSDCTVGRDSVPRVFDCTSFDELVVLELLVALERDPVDHRILDHRHDQPAAGLVDAHVLEQAGGVERLERLIDLVAVEPPARTEPEIGADGLGFDAPVAFDDDRARGLRRGIAGGRNRPYSGAESDPGEDQADQAKAPNSRTHKFMRNAPFPPLSPTDRRYLRTLLSTMFLQAFSQLCNPSKCRIFRFSRRKLPRSKAPLRTPKAAAELDGVIKDCKDHQHHDDRETDPEPDFLGPLRQRTAADRLDRVEQK